MTKQKMTQYSIPVRNQPECFAKVAELLAQEGINITGLMTEGSGEVAFVRFLSDRESQVVRKPLQLAGYEVFENPCYVLELANQPGQFSKLAQTLAEEDIKILNVYGTTNGGEKAKLVLVVDQSERAQQALAKMA